MVILKNSLVDSSRSVILRGVFKARGCGTTSKSNTEAIEGFLVTMALLCQAIRYRDLATCGTLCDPTTSETNS